jgi:hypothetical protein
MTVSSRAHVSPSLAGSGQLNRQLADWATGGRENRVGQSGSDRQHAGLADSANLGATLDQAHIASRRLGELNATGLDPDIAAQGFGEAHCDSPSICADGHVAHSIRIGCPGGAISTTCATMLA